MSRRIFSGLGILVAAALELCAAGAVPAAEDATNTLSLTISDAVLMALERNPAMAVQRLGPAMTKTREGVERAAFDPVLGVSAAGQKSDGLRLSQSGTNVLANLTRNNDADVNLGVTLPTGTRLAADGSLNGTSVNDDDPLYTARAGLTAVQPLLRGAGTAVNLASLRQARLETRMSGYEFRGFSEAFVAQVERACWEIQLARQRLDIQRESLRLAEEQLAETRERIRLGALAAVERAAAEAEAALRRQSLINAESALAVRRLTLLRLLNPGGATTWETQPVIQPPSTPPEDAGSLEQHVEMALRQRPELNQTQLAVQRNELEVVKTRNGLLPRLDVFITLGRSGYADSFGGSLRGEKDKGYDAGLGVSGDWPVGDRRAHALHERATLDREQARLALENLRMLVQNDVRAAFIEAQRCRDQIGATAVTRRLQEEKLRAETEKFRLGKSTTLLVAQAQRDAEQGRLDEAQAVMECRVALIELYRLDGTLLQRRGLDAPCAAFGAEATLEDKPAR